MAGKATDTAAEGGSALMQGFNAYSESVAGKQDSCVVGAALDEDGMNQRPVAALKLRSDASVAWVRQLDGIEEAFQSRATHCVSDGTAVYVLIQSDMQAAQALSQTLLKVVKLDMKGKVQGTMALDVPEAVGRAYSAWVEDRPADFVWENGRLVLSGKYFLLSQPGKWHSFSMNIDTGIE